MTPDRQIRRRLAIALFGAIVLHNAEEAITFARYRDKAAQLIQTIVGTPVSVPSTVMFQIALVIVTLAAALALAFAANGQASPSKWRVIVGVALIMAINVLVPHVPAAIAFGGYAPGVVTAVLINAPIALWVITSVRRLV
jgi:hypothetical protein